MKKPIVTFCCALCFAVSAFGQQAVVHENIVKPSLNDEYLQAVAKIKEACAVNKVKMTFRTFAYDDNTYAHVLPVEGTASYEIDHFAELKGKIGAEAFEKLVANMQPGIEQHLQSIVTYMPGHSYLDPQPGENYRWFLNIIPLPGKESEMENLLVEWKNAFASRKLTENFHTYKVTSESQSGYLISLSAKNEADMAAKRMKSLELLGEENARLFKKQLAMTKKYYWRRGQFVPALGYTYSNQ